VEPGSEAESSTPLEPTSEPPNGMYKGRVDDKGRLKLPVGFQQYIAGFPEKKLFVTSLDRRIGQLYPIKIWRGNKDFLLQFKDNPQAAKRITFNAQDLGADAEMDSQGRVQLPPEMRRELGIENQTVRLFAHKGRIQIMSEAMYEEQKREAAVSAAQDLDVLERAGMM
jgi:MraZ protein